MEMVGNCYQVKMEDLLGEEQIEATFHSDCKELFQRQVRRGRIMVMRDVALFSLNPRNPYLIVKAECVVSVVK